MTYGMAARARLFRAHTLPCARKGSSRRCWKVQVSAERDTACPTDFYQLLAVEPTASTDEIRTQYRRLQKFCHPDVVGEAGEPVCVLLNHAYDTLTDDEMRLAYDEERRNNGSVAAGFDGRMRSYWNGDPDEEQGTFVDETTCIGCRMCNNIAPNTFTMEAEHGRARVFCQWGNARDDIQDAINSCPVDCIHWVRKQELPILEYVVQEGAASKRVGVAIMNGNPGRRAHDPFDAAFHLSRRLEEQGQEWMEKGNTFDGDKLSKDIRRAWLNLSEEVRLKGWGNFIEGIQ